MHFIGTYLLLGTNRKLVDKQAKLEGSQITYLTYLRLQALSPLGGISATWWISLPLSPRAERGLNRSVPGTSDFEAPAECTAMYCMSDHPKHSTDYQSVLGR